MAILILVNVLADMAIGSPMMVLPQLLERFDTEQAAWLNASAMLAGAIWSPLLAKSSDIFGKRRVLIATLLLACSATGACSSRRRCSGRNRRRRHRIPQSRC
jgi:MFS family permease